MVGHQLRHNTAVDVSVVGVRVTEEHTYRGTLTSVFPDGARRERRVEGVLQRRYLNNIRPEYSRVYRIKPSVTVSAAGASSVEEDEERRPQMQQRHEETWDAPASVVTPRPRSYEDWSSPGVSSSATTTKRDHDWRRSRERNRAKEKV